MCFLSSSDHDYMEENWPADDGNNPDNDDDPRNGHISTDINPQIIALMMI